MSLQRTFLILLVSGFSLLPVSGRAQISAGGRPIGLSKARALASIETVRLDRGPVPRRSLAAPSHQPDSTTLLPYAYGTETDVAIDLKSQGTVQSLPDGGRLWQLRITAPTARGLRFTYDRFRVPPGATFFVYDERGTVVRGAFNERNNAPHGGFATALTPGKSAILEYYEPARAPFSGEIRVASVVQAQRRPYPSAPLSGDAYQASALGCSINTACPEGDPWSAEARATVLIDRGGDTCSGVLLNNTSEDFAPYILTAQHCGSPAVGDTLDWVVTFNYASPSCADPATTPAAQSMTGVVVRAAQSGWREDYALLELLNPIPSSYDAYYAGWSIEESPSQSSVTISHPRGDIRKITLDDDPLIDFSTRWVATFDHGTIEGGSSGAPLFNEDHQVIGHVRGAWSIDFETCSGPGGDDNAATIVFPKLEHIWDAGDPGTRVADFLDPLDSGQSHLNGLDGASTVASSEAWISEIDTRTANTSDTDDAEFIEIAGPAGSSLEGYQVDIYTCSSGTTSLRASEVITADSNPMLTDDFEGVGFFVLGGTGLSLPAADQQFSTDAGNLLPDGRGLILLRDPAGREVFDYQYDETVDGIPTECPPSRLTRSRGDDISYESTVTGSTASSSSWAKNTLGSTAIGFREQMPPSASASGTADIVPSPGRENNQAMPVELTRFDAVADDQTVRLSWTTASETNNAGFEIQHQGQDGFETLAFVAGHGTTARPHNYSFSTTALQPGLHRFRLRQIDYSGTASFSPTVEVQVNAAAPYQLSRPHPNPFRYEATLTLTVARPQHVEVALYDVLGRRVASLHDGTVPANEPTSLEVDAGSLPSGLYIVRVVGERFTASQKMTLLR